MKLTFKANVEREFFLFRIYLGAGIVASLEIY
jgi:hypothetical protein